MKKLLRLICIITSTAFIYAQKADAKSTQILDAVAKKYNANKNTFFKFSYGSGQKGKITKTETGTFYTTPTQHRLKIMGIEQIFDGNKVYNISSEDQEVTIAKANGSEMMFSPTNYLNSYKKEYNTTYAGKKTIEGKSTEQIKLTPIKSNGIKEVNIYIDTKQNQILRIDQTSTDNSFARISIQEYKANQNLSADTFTFKKANYKNYIITEL
ncbi:LolA family protein [Bergeyella cardium]|uniref:Outer membrane lipoprotein carrier protein LolA n=1 Tax=Bergeyella cardium TaxID=1585976 RepID=A0A6P1QVG5_9FLAO|nr:outer membrane lipoprotein carrier protein LolA [Bergeyella cardium]QHN65755.1 outer membrane lipoprotein carrier protein LolA [Bergeyella cardium]WHE33345.1 outer membrane lipoprotein carrier protein LolA [Bergeyella cardium]WHF59994.1 outer membrane lipoprotein carrier protein LolA [Bergeyella cardium]